MSDEIVTGVGGAVQSNFVHSGSVNPFHARTRAFTRISDTQIRFAGLVLRAIESHARKNRALGIRTHTKVKRVMTMSSKYQTIANSPRDESVRMADWDFSLWFALLSPLIGVLLGFLGGFLLYLATDF
jgi:hypothetical protein